MDNILRMKIRRSSSFWSNFKCVCMETDFTSVSITWQGDRYELILTASLMDKDYILRKERNLLLMETRPQNIKQKSSLEQCFDNTWSNQLLLNYQFPWQLFIHRKETAVGSWPWPEWKIRIVNVPRVTSIVVIHPDPWCPQGFSWLKSGSDMWLE